MAPVLERYLKVGRPALPGSIRGHKWREKREKEKKNIEELETKIFVLKLFYFVLRNFSRTKRCVKIAISVVFDALFINNSRPLLNPGTHGRTANQR